MAIEPAAISAKPAVTMIPVPFARGDRARQSRRQRERNREAVGHSDHDVAHGSGGREVFFHVFDGWHLIIPPERLIF